METRQIHIRELSTVTGIQQIEHAVQSIYFLGLEDFEGDVYISIESDDYSNEAIPLTNNIFIIGQPMTLYNTTYACQIYGVLNGGEKIQLSKRFRLIVDKSNDIQGDSSQYPIDPNFTNGIIEFMNEQKEQVQSEIEATGDAVIASIPSDYTALEQATYNAYPTQSETGNPVYFDDGADDIPVKELIVNLEPKQEGSGDPSPSNVRPISGFDGVTVKRAGKNLLPLTPKTVTTNGVTATINSNGTISLTGTATADNFVVLQENILLSSGTYCLKEFTAQGASDYAGTRAQIISFRPDVYLSIPWNSTVGYTTGTLENRDSYLFRLRVKSGVNYNGVTITPMLTIGNEVPTEFEPFVDPDEYSITFPSSVGTVYGGSLNVTTGLLTIDRYNLWLDPTKIPDSYIHFDVLTNNARIGNLILTTHFGLTSAYGAKYSSEATFRNGALSNWSVEKNKGYSSDTSGFYFSGTDRFYLFCPKSIFATQDASGFKQYLTDNPLYICYELATPITYQLTPTEISTLLGSNTIQSDGSMNLQYRADTTTIIEKLTNAIISLGGNV